MVLRPPSSFSMLRFRASLAALALFAACAPKDRDVAARAAADDAPPPVDTARPMSAPDDSVQLALLVPRSVARGAPVAFTLRIRNVSGRALTLYLRGREITFDVVVTGAGGQAVWRRLEGAAVPAIVRLEEMAPGAELSLPATWDQQGADGRPVADGEYRAHAELLTQDAPIVGAAVAFRIGSP